MNWLLLGIISACCTALVTIFTKIGVRDVKSNFATCYRSLIVILFSLLLCILNHSLKQITSLNGYNWLFLILSGFATGISWLSYNKALSLGDVHLVAPIDKCSFVFTSILFVIFFFDDTTSSGNPLTISMLVLANLLMIGGTLLMVYQKAENKKNKLWLVFALISALSGSGVSLLIKLGLKGIPTSLGTLIRTIVVFFISLIIVLVKKEYQGMKLIAKKSMFFLTLSGIATGLAWLSEYSALNIDGVNGVAIASCSKLAILLTMLFSVIFLKEKFSKRTLFGLGILTSGIILIIVFSL